MKGAVIRRFILHVDMDAFYASVEQRDRPDLRGKPVVVGGSPEERGVVAAASYEARKFGIRSAMPMSRALRLCPEAVLVSPRFSEYRKASEIIHRVFFEYTSVIEPVSLDEAYLDVSDSVTQFEHAETIGRRIKETINERTHLTASVGIGPNKYIAKIASDYKKPNGFFVVPEKKVIDFLTPLPVRCVPGVGEKTEQRMHILKIETIGQLRNIPRKTLQEAFGIKHGDRLYELARGIDESPVVTDQARKSLSQEQTFPQDIASKERMQAILKSLSEDVSQLLVKNGLKGRNVGIKVRFSDFRIATRALTLDHRTSEAEEIGGIAVQLLNKIDLENRRVRLLGVRMAGFDPMPESPETPPPRDLQLWFW